MGRFSFNLFQKRAAAKAAAKVAEEARKAEEALARKKGHITNRERHYEKYRVEYLADGKIPNPRHNLKILDKHLNMSEKIKVLHLMAGNPGQVGDTYTYLNVIRTAKSENQIKTAIENAKKHPEAGNASDHLFALQSLPPEVLDDFIQIAKQFPETGNIMEHTKARRNAKSEELYNEALEIAKENKGSVFWTVARLKKRR